MSAARFAAQLQIARITDEFYAAYKRCVLKLLERERALHEQLLGPNANTRQMPNETGQPLSRERLAELVEGMTESQLVALAETVANNA